MSVRGVVQGTKQGARLRLLLLCGCAFRQRGAGGLSKGLAAAAGPETWSLHPVMTPLLLT